MLQIGAALFYYKLRQALLQIRTASLLQIVAGVVTNLGSYYKLGQPLLKKGHYYKLGQNVLQIGAGITNQGNYYKLGHKNIQEQFLLTYLQLYHKQCF